MRMISAWAFALIAVIWSVSSKAASQTGPLESPETQAAAQALVQGARTALRPPAASEEAVGMDEPGEVTFAEAAQFPIEVSDGIWRSARPNVGALTRLYDMGVRTVLNLEGGDPYTKEKEAMRQIEEYRAAQHKPDWHITSQAVPMSGIGRPSFEQVDKALAILSDPAKRPILVHCKHGEDRTGVVVAAYRVEIEKRLSLDEAIAEAESLHCCHLVLIGKNALRDFLAEYHEHRQSRP